MGGKKKEYTREQYEEAIRLLQQGCGTHKVGKMLNIPQKTIYWWWRGIHKPPSTRWEPKPSKELAYVLGTLLGDGKIRTQRGAIALISKDREFVDEFSKCLATILNKPKKIQHFV